VPSATHCGRMHATPPKSDGDSEQHYADNEHHRVGRTSCVVSISVMPGLLRAQRCASSTFPLSRVLRPLVGGLRTSPIVRTMAEPIPLPGNASAASFVAAL